MRQALLLKVHFRRECPRAVNRSETPAAIIGAWRALDTRAPSRHAYCGCSRAKGNQKKGKEWQ
jgi:hypothetical protein